MNGTNDEKDRFSGRLRRYGRVGRQAAYLAGRVVTNRVGSTDREKAATALTEALGELKGPLMKVAQILATIPDALPQEYLDKLATLQSHAPPMRPSFAARRMAGELGPDWQARFSAFDLKPSGAASLGQVHAASALDGEKLICKLQYPDMESAVSADLHQLRLAMAIYRRTNKAIDPTLIYTELAERLHEEIDYLRESRNMALYGTMLADTPGVQCPVSHPDLCTRRLLTMTRLDGHPLLSLRNEDQQLRNQIARNLFAAWYRPFYRYGVIHGDPHLGNYSADLQGRINLLDYGCIRVFPPSFVAGVIELGDALITQDDDRACAAYQSWGFTISSREMLETLNLWARFAYAPILSDQVSEMAEQNSTAQGVRVLNEVHIKLRQLGGVRPPREFVLMDRAAIGLGSAFHHLGARLNWRQLYLELIDGFDREILAQRQAEALSQAAC